MFDHPIPPAEDTAGTAAYAAVIEAVTNGGDLRVTTWILNEMTSSFMLNALSSSHRTRAGAPHPYAPGAGGSYDERLEEVGRHGAEPPGLREEAQRAAVLLYAAILKAPGGYDPAPALVRWDEDKAVDDRWYGPRMKRTDLEASARCWGHYAVMEALGHGVAWSDDNEPLVASYDVPLVELPSVGDLGILVDGVVWTDEYTEAAHAKAHPDEEE